MSAPLRLVPRDGGSLKVPEEPIRFPAKHTTMMRAVILRAIQKLEQGRADDWTLDDLDGYVTIRFEAER